MRLFKREHLHFSADDPPLELLHRRLKVGDRVSSAVLAEIRDWGMIRRSLDPEEVPWARIAARGYFPPAARGDGFLFLTDRHLFFALGPDAKSVPLSDLIDVRLTEPEERTPQRGWMFVSFRVREPVLENQLEIVAAVPARAFVAFYPTIAEALRSAARDARRAVPTWGSTECVALFADVSNSGRSVPGMVSITMDGNLVFTSHDGNGEALWTDVADPNVWMSIADNTSGWNLDGIDGGRAVVVHDVGHLVRYYLQPNEDDGSFGQWAGRLVDLGIRDRPPGWTE